MTQKVEELARDAAEEALEELELLQEKKPFSSLDREVIEIYERLFAKGYTKAMDQKSKFCPCGGIILADTEDFETPLCNACFEEVVASRDAEVRSLINLEESLVRILEDLICRTNAVTAPHRHGQAIDKDNLDQLSNRQIEVEQAIARHKERTK